MSKTILGELFGFKPSPRFSDLVGKILVSFEISKEENEILITTNDGEKYKLHHTQDCCELVVIESIEGDIDDILNSPIVIALESSNSEKEHVDYGDSYTWTFYKLDTIKGGITIRWYGASNGYYSESVYFERLE